MAEYHDLVAALTWLVVQKLQHQGRYVRGLLGDGQGHVQVPERPDYSYVRPDRYTTRKFEVFNKLVDGYDGMPVVLGELPWQPGLTQVLAVDWDTYEGVGWGDQWSGVKRHGASHEWRDGAPGYDTFNVYRRQFGDLKTYPLGSGSLSVYVSAYNFTHLESLKSWPGYPGLSLLGARPSATGTARMVLVYWDPASGTAGALGVATGTLGADAGPEIMNWPYAPPGTIPSAWIKLRGGQGFVSEFDIWDARQPWTPTLEFSTGSAGIWAGLIPIADDGGFFTGSTVEQALQELGAGGGGAPSGPAGGDLTGTYPNPNLGAIWGYPVQSGAPAQGDIWMFSGTAWRHIPSNFPTTLAALDDVFLAHPPVDGEMLVYRTADVAWTNEDGKDTHDHSKLAASDGVPNPAWSVDAAGNLAAAGAYSLDVNAGELILDADADTSLTADTDDQIDVKVANADQVQFKDGSFVPVTDNDIDLGDSTHEFKDAYVDGTLNADLVDLDGNADALVLDADGDTSISAPTDDQIDIEIGGSDLVVIDAEGITVATRIVEPVWVDYPLQDTGNVLGLTSHFRDNTASYPAGWTEVDAPALVATNTIYSFWKLTGSSSDLSWKYKAQSSINLENLAASEIVRLIIGPILLYDSRPTVDVDYYLGMYRNNAGAIDENTYSRIHIHWDSATTVWQIRGEEKDGSTAHNGTYFTLDDDPLRELFVQAWVRNTAAKRCDAYYGGNYRRALHKNIFSQNPTSAPTWGQMWVQFHQTRGAGVTLNDEIYIGALDRA